MNPSPQALEGVRVVEFTTGMAGPWIGRFMAWCGAEVIRVESKTRPGVVRLYIPPWDRSLGVQERLSPWFTDWDAGKLFVSLDLTKPDAVALAKKLVARADIVIENQSCGVMEKLGLGWEALVAVNPKLIGFSSSGFGEGGPAEHFVTWGPNIEAVAGLAGLSGFPQRECTTTQYAYPDGLSALHGLFAILCALESALHGLFAILCALDHRERTGEGQRIGLSQFEATAAAIGPQLMDQLAHGREPQKLGNASLHAAPHGCYRCAGVDRWCVISVLDEAAWRGLCRVMGRGAWLEDPRFADAAGRLACAGELDAAIEAWTSERDPHDAMEQLQAAGVAAGAVQDAEDQFERDGHLADRAYFERIPHLAKGEVVATGIPLGLTETPGHTSRAGACIGEDDEYVFRDLLGLSPEEIAAARRVGAIESED